MRTILILLFCASIATCPAMAQEDIFGALTEAAKALEDAQGEAGEAADNSAEEMSEEERRWREEWEKDREENEKLFNDLDTKYLKCTALMVLYVHAYLKLVNEHKIGEIGMSACDAYGMQALALASSTTIMYCPEEMAQLSDEELKSIGDDFMAAINQFTVPADGPWDNPEYHPVLSKLHYIISSFLNGVADQDAGDLSVYNGAPDTPIHIMKYIIEFFRPRYIIPQALKIAQEMEAMGCSG